MNVYSSSVVSELGAYYGSLLQDFEAFQDVQSHLHQIAIHLYEGLKKKVPCLYVELNNYNKKFIGKSVEELSRLEFSLVDAQETIAQEYGFESWQALSNQNNLIYTLDYQRAVDLLLNGETIKLQGLLEQNPSLIHHVSSYGHQAQLIHYVGSNGVELWRQKVPMNLPKITKMLLELGADQNAKMKVYGGTFTLIELVTTSAHPSAAGVLKEILELL